MTKGKKPTKKQATAMQLIREGVPPTVAMRKAGYSAKTAEAPSQNLLRSAKVQDIIEHYKAEYLRLGITPTYLVEKTKEAIEATKIKTSLTEPDREVPDWETRLKAMEMVRTDWGMGGKEPPTQAAGQIVNIETYVQQVEKDREIGGEQ